MTNRSRTSAGRSNFAAACITLVSAGLLYANFDPAPAGEEMFAFTAAPVVPFVDFTDAPLPPPAPAAEITDKSEKVATEKSLSELVELAPGEMTSDDALRFTLLLMQDGQKVVNTYDNYTVTFHREERISGDMRPCETIAMKVQHAPHFAVYMKWMTSDRGQQLLFNETDKDGCMTVKLGGFKRFLPAVRLEPTSGMAMEKSRYPVTEAGLSNMMQQIIDHRQKDVERGHGIVARRMADQTLNGQECYCLRFDYESPEISDVYRKSMIMIDKDLHTPVMIRNFTWQNSDVELPADELDQATLVENYSFTDLDVSSKLVATDFSKDNPAYRM